MVNVHIPHCAEGWTSPWRTWYTAPLLSCTSHTPGDGHKPLSLSLFRPLYTPGNVKRTENVQRTERRSWTWKGPPSCQLVGICCRFTVSWRSLHVSHKCNLHSWFSQKGCLATFVLKFNFLIILYQLQVTILLISQNNLGKKRKGIDNAKCLGVLQIFRHM